MARKKKKKHGEEEGGEAWLLPYSDLMTLLLAVFIVLFAVSKVDQTKAEAVAEAFRESMMSEGAGPFAGEGSSIISLSPNGEQQQNQNNETDSANASVTPSEAQATDAPKENTKLTQEQIEEFLGQSEYNNLDELKTEIDAMFKDEKLMSEITTSIDARGLVISLNNAILFDSGSADIITKNENTLTKIAKIVNTLDNYIRIEGHTDDIPIKTATYPSNWELSTARAASVVRLFIDKCSVSPEKVVAVGYGEYKPIADNSTEAGRAKNRRIDIIVLSEKYNNLEGGSQK